MTADDLSQAFERYNKFSPQTARSIFEFHRQRMKEEAEERKTVEKSAQKPDAKKAPARASANSPARYADSMA